MSFPRVATTSCFGFFLVGLLALAGCDSQPKTDLLWDSYGVPHIYSSDAVGMFKAQGWAQMEAHGDLILRLYGQARGRAAEYWGYDYQRSDLHARGFDIPGLAEAWFAEQDPEMKEYLRAFVEGMNEYAQKYPDALEGEVEVVLPVLPEDVLGHLIRVIHFNFVSSPTGIPGRLQNAFLQDSEEGDVPGSNAWAIGPTRSASGNAMLLANPHLPWNDFFLWFENHLVGPDFDAYGATLVGMPLVTIGFTDHLGWTHTVNTFDGSDTYELTLEGDGYLFDGEVLPFEETIDTLKVKEDDGAMRERIFEVQRTVHGPVVFRGSDGVIAQKVVGLDSPHVFRQYYDMLSAENLQEFEGAMSMLQMPMFTTMYADQAGHIMHLFNGLVPVRHQGDVDFWDGVVPGNTSETLWTEYHPYGDLPKSIDPESGWLQNANDPPWTTTFPRPDEMDPARYPPYMAPEFMHSRAQISAGMLLRDESITFDELVEYKHSTHMRLADQLVPELIAAAREAGGEEVSAAADVLESWDRNADVGSRGAILFLAWTNAFVRRALGEVFVTPWDRSDPMETPHGLAEPDLAVQVLAEVARRVVEDHGALDVPFGEVYRVRRDDLDLPGNGVSGGAGVFRAAGYAQAADGRYQVTGGDTFVLAIEFGEPIRAMAVLGYGNASQEGSPHRTDQLHFFSEKRLRPVWRTREEIEANLSSRVSWE